MSTNRGPGRKPQAKREDKLTPRTEISGQQAVNLVEAVTLKMEFLWHVKGAFDPGIDGRIELRDARTQEPLARYIGVQVKGYAKYTAENGTGFEFLCDQGDITYWMRSQDPVLLVCAHPATGEAWFVCVTDWFSDAERRAERRVVFDKTADRFDESQAVKLLQLAFRSEPTAPRRQRPGDEELVTNLLAITAHGGRIWSASTDMRSREDVNERYLEVGGARASDYLLKDGKLYALRDPRGCALRHLCDAERVTSVPSADWAASDDPRLSKYWVELLRRALLHQVKRELRWHQKRGLFYYPAPDPLADLHIKGPNAQRLVVKVSRYIKDGDERISYVRHQAFKPSFVRADRQWYLEVEPTYLFTYDGEHETRKTDLLLAGIKRLEKNLAVLGHLRMWEYVLTRPASLLDGEPRLLTLGKLASVQVQFGIDDDTWRGEASDDDRIPGQGELAA
jgi:hypothetical protein